VIDGSNLGRELRIVEIFISILSGMPDLLWLGPTNVGFIAPLNKCTFRWYDILKHSRPVQFSDI
jgi:hypothetical protein